ncbi:hypothetical protein NON00_07515 [Roseomonas sp. GC11]|uniref:hypothetical protein n=1 Tax=Roseomonas sp. GC11 TaxID=2950546 RepID=UPI00210E4C42|nr:hypothetical protein [Roseomonas sp. GC11]MCQ4159774.1 hypothetical protein [Roseomonas sp. GC11]
MSRRDLLAPEDLQPAIRRVIADYTAFVGRAPEPGAHDDAKAFAAHHAAAKSALAHLEHLLKLARAQGAGGEEQGAAEASALLQQARGALSRAPEEDEEDSEPDDGASR